MKLLLILFALLQAGTPEEDNWTPLEIDDNLTISFPADRDLQDLSFQKTYTANRDGEPVVFVRIDNALAPEDYQQNLAVRKNPAEFYRGFISGFAQSQNLKVSEYQSVAVDGLQGVRFTAEADTIAFTSQAVLVGEIIYAATVYYGVGKKDAVNSEIEQLFSSFDFTVDPREQFLEEQQESAFSDFQLGKLAGKLVMVFLIGVIIFIVVRSVSKRKPRKNKL